ncbi:AraC family transcriptional regulator [Paenibacillus psychroresistens]|uniref:AraC family transcriptional regulator n=1 Tax=Paenibacillus psychroresistens TaxID=1778678 RepID=A0A6B8RRJ1_9BACL|nr:AraC family transcriptional regulator [Paenibacillus psychroresistens]QGQ98103.1 AraC family transcriptional regulator [Paenibacillus psychroresistens]
MIGIDTPVTLRQLVQYNPERPYREANDLYVSYWGKEDCNPGHAVGPGIREFYKVHFIHKGKGIVRIGKETFSLRAGQAFMIYPQVITYYEADAEEPWSYSWIAFQGSQIAHALSRTSVTPEHPVFPMDMRIMPRIYEQLSEAVAFIPSANLRLSAILMQFLAELTDVAPAASLETIHPQKHDVYVHKCIEFFKTHYSEKISVEQVAASLQLDRKYLSALFKKALGLPPQQYLLQYRMERAEELLIKGIYSIGEVARSVGYQDALLFSKMFKKVKGSAPKHFLLNSPGD